MPRQRCPNCDSDHDVSIFVTGQKVRCNRCGIRFEVHRDDVSGADHTVAPSSLRGPADGNAAVDLASAIAEDATAMSKGLSVPGYEILNVVGRGGMGEVYLAEQVSLGRTVALKVLADHLAADASFAARFEKESAALAALSHPNIVNIIDRGRAGDTLYFVMEYVEGRSLRELLAGGPLSASDAVKIVAQICRAIDYAHAKGVIHRDLKPENILVDTRGHVKVADFGLAGIVGADEQLHMTRTDVAMGTFNYMAPEQRKDARSVDGRADLYSLGVMLYELLTGEVPAGRFRLPSERLEGLDRRVDDIVCRALESDPSQRYQRASMVGDDLEALLSGQSLTAAPTEAPTYAPGAASSSGEIVQVSDGGSRSGSAIEWAKGAGSVVEKAGKGVFALVKLFLQSVMVLAVTLALIGLAIAFTVKEDGCSGPELRVDEEGITLGGSGTAAGVVETDQESPILVPMKLRVDGKDSVRRDFDFADDTAGEAEWYLYRGHWRLWDGALVHDVYAGGRGVVASDRIPRAFLGGERFFADGFRVEADVELRQKPLDEDVSAKRAKKLDALRRKVSGDEAPTAKLYLYRNRKHFFALTVTGGEEGGYTVSWNLGDGARYGAFTGGTGLPEPQWGSRVRLALWVQGDRVYASVDGREVGRAEVGALGPDNWGKAGLGCEHAVCLFDDVQLRGRNRPPPGESGGDPGAEVAEPVEP